MIKFIHLGDLHLGIKFHKRSLIEDQYVALQQVLELMAEQQANLIIAGDVFDTVNPSIEAQELWYNFLSEAAILNSVNGTSAWVIPGNHDSAARLGLAKDFIKSGSIHIVDNTDLYKIFQADSVNLACVPFVKPTTVESQLGVLTSTYDEAYRVVVHHLKDELNGDLSNTVLVAHQTFEGGKTGESEFKPFMADAIALETVKEFPIVMAGHLHAKQSLDNVWYSGSLLPYAFGDDYTASITMWTYDDGKWSKEELPLSLEHPLKVIQGDLAHCLEEEADGCYVKVKLVNCLYFDEALSKLEDKFPLLCSVVTDSQDDWVADLSKPVAAFCNLEEALDAFCEHLEVPKLNTRRKELIQEALDAYSKTEDL